jgi:hypothetical protein
MTPEKMNLLLREFRLPVLLEAGQDLVHAFTPQSDRMDYASWAITVAVIICLGWIGTAKVRLPPLQCAAAGLCLFIASFAFSNAIALIAHPGPSPFMVFAAGLFVAFFISPLAGLVAMIGVGIARVSLKRHA